MGMTPDERAAKKKRDKQRQKENKNKPTSLRAPSSVGSAVSGSNSFGGKSGAKVKAHKEVLPDMKKVDRTTAIIAGYDAPAPRSAVFQEGIEDHDTK